MRSPIQDGNAGASQQEAPVQKHAVRTATVARHNDNKATKRLAQQNQLTSGLGSALTKFMVKKDERENEIRYQKAYNQQGVDEGISEYTKDLKKTGFTEFIYGGQSPEYKGAIDAASRNASNAMFLEEHEFIEGEGADLTPEQYHARTADRVRGYVEDHFKDTPDAAYSFLKNWQENSNALSKQHYKLYQVREQEKARATVAEGFQTDFGKYKKLFDTDRDTAQQLGVDMFSGKYKPSGMSDASYRAVIVSESINAIQAGDYTALKLFNESGMPSGLRDKELAQYQKAVKVIDTDNANLVESARSNYITVMNQEGTRPHHMEAARQEFERTQQMVAARVTGTSKHIKTVYGADRHSGEIGKQYREHLASEAKKMNKAAIELSKQEIAKIEYKLLRTTDPTEKRQLVAFRIDHLETLRSVPNMDEAERDELTQQLNKELERIAKWDSEFEAQDKKYQEKLAEAKVKEDNIESGVESLLTGYGYTTGVAGEQKEHLKAALDGIANTMVVGDETSVQKMRKIFSSPDLIKNWLTQVDDFSEYAITSKDVLTSVRNLQTNLQAQNETKEYSQLQKQNITSLAMIRENNMELYNAAFPDSKDQFKIQMIEEAINNGGDVTETNKRINNVATGANDNIEDKLSASDFMEFGGFSDAPSDMKNKMFTYYKNMLPLGHDRALELTRKHALGYNTKAGEHNVRYGGTFKQIGDRKLPDVLNTLQQTYKSGNVHKTGLDRVLREVIKGSKDANGNDIRSLNQMKDVELTIQPNGSLRIAWKDRVQFMSRHEMENELRGYDEFARRQANKQIATYRRW